jgi:hypothetical protein
VPSDFGSKVLKEAAKSTTARPWGWRPIYAVLFVVMLSLGFLWIEDGAEREDAQGFAGAVPGGPVLTFWDPEDHQEPSSYVEVVVEDPLAGNIILRLPSVIQIHRTDLHEASNLRNVSY